MMFETKNSTIKTPYVGMPATIMFKENRKPVTVIKIISDTHIVVQLDDYSLKRNSDDKFDKYQKYEYNSNPNNPILNFKKVNIGKPKEQFRLDGKKNGWSIKFGIREMYYDINF